MKRLRSTLTVALAATVALLGRCSFAAEETPTKVWLSPGAVTTHSKPTFDDGSGTPRAYNGANGGLILRIAPSEAWSVAAGQVRNSEHHPSRFVMAHAAPWRWRTALGTVKVGGAVGLASGYQRFDRQLGPAALFTAGIEADAVSVQAFMAPPIEKGGGVLGVTVEVRIW